MSVELNRRRFTAKEYERMVETGILTEADHVELIDGEIVEMSAMGSWHTMCLIVLNRLRASLAEDRALVLIQGPLRVDDRHEFAPDVLLLRPRPGGYWRSIPSPPDVFLVIEVADTSLDRARQKVRHYAEGGIPEVWIVNFQDEVVEVHRTLATDGYRHVQRIGRGSEVSPEAFPDVRLSVSDLFG